MSFRPTRTHALLIAVAFAVVILGCAAGFKYYQAHINDAFADAYEKTVQANGRAFLVAHDSLVNDVPQNVLQSNGRERWKLVSRVFYSDVRALEKFYAPLAECLRNRGCWPRDEGGAFCTKASREALAYQEVMRRLGLIKGISINRTNGRDDLGEASGSSFQAAPIGNLTTITERICAKELDRLVQAMAAQRPERVAAAKSAWTQIKARGSVVEMRDFPVSFDEAFDVASKPELEQAVQEASDATKKQIQAQLCQQHRDMEAIPEDFDRKDKEFSKYFLSPVCRLMGDGSRKCTWSGFYSQTTRLLIGREITAPDEDRQTSYLSDMVKECVPSSCRIKKETPGSFQNDWGFKCKALDREYECGSDNKPLDVSVVTCFEISSLQISTPVPPPPIPEEESAVTSDIKNVEEGYRQCQGKITLRGCLAQIRAVLCKNAQTGTADPGCGADFPAALTSLSSQCVKSGLSNAQGKWGGGGSWSIVAYGTGARISSVPQVENVFMLELATSNGSGANFGQLQTISSGSRTHAIVDGHRFAYGIGAHDLLTAMLAGSKMQLPHLDDLEKYETVDLSVFKTLYGQISAIYKSCGYWEGAEQ